MAVEAEYFVTLLADERFGEGPEPMVYYEQLFEAMLHAVQVR